MRGTARDAPVSYTHLTEHFMSDLHGENEAFVHILNSASGVIREKVDQVLGLSLIHI